jgi:hypothetical protein
MASKEIVGLLTLTDRDGNVFHQGSNISYRYATKYRVIYKWNNNYGGVLPVIVAFPWKMAFLMNDDDITLGHDTFFRAAGAIYPDSPTGSAVTLGTTQFNFYRESGTVGTVGTANIPRVFGGVGIVSNYPGLRGGMPGAGDQLLSQVDVPLDYTQIGIVYFHPAHQQAATVTTAVGLSYVTYTNAGFWDNAVVSPGVFGLIRIESGADAGYYFVQNNDYNSNRLYLRCLDGTPFKALAAASVLATAAPGRRAWFNETGIIPLSVGGLTTSGRFNPRKNDPYLRDSYIMRLIVEKTGSTEVAAGTEQQGSYLMSLLPFTHGDGIIGGTRPDDRSTNALNLYGVNGNEAIPSWFQFLQGGVNGAALDWENQRFWFGYTNVSNQSGLAHWRYKTGEGWREVANYLGTAGQASFLSPTPVLGAGDIIVDLEMGSAAGTARNWVYVVIGHASGGNAGVVIIKPDLTTLQYTTGSGVPAAPIGGCSLDRTRTRAAFGDVSTDASNNVTTASGAFTNSDIGRVIKLTGLGADSGTYKISTVGGATTVGVTTLAGGAVTFTTQSGGSFEIGDRLYLFFNDNTTGAGKINYMESMAPGTFLTRTVAMTNGANINTRVPGGVGHIYGQREMSHIDTATGDVYWLSNDVQQQINKYTVATNTHSLLAITNTSLLQPAGSVLIGGSATTSVNPASPTIFSAIHVNSKFDDIWVGSDAGHFKITKSTFAASSAKRYYGNESTGYVSGPALTTGTGNGASGLTFSTPTVTLNATGTPFTAADVGKYVMITGATTAGNNGVFRITTFNSSSSISFSNTSGAAQANYAGTFYVVATWAQRVDTGQFALSNSRHVRSYWEGPDGRMYSLAHNNSVSQSDTGRYSQEADSWTYGGNLSGNDTNQQYFVYATQDGRAIALYPSASSSPSRFYFWPLEVEYQWDNGNSKWIPKEHVRTSTPNKSVSDTTSPNALGRPIHSTAEEVLFGVKVQWNRQGGATPPNNEFLGRGGQSRTTTTDGTTTVGTGTFGGSGFTAGDVEKLLRIEAGAGLLASEYRVYKVTAFINAASVTLSNMDGSAFLASANTTGMTYTVWDLGTPGSNAGPENITVMLADGFGKDNTQDLSGMSYEHFGWKVRYSEHTEARKFTVENPLAVPGSTETKVYFETYARATPQYDAALSHHRGLPAAEATSGRHLIDWMQDKYLDGTGAKANLRFTPANAGVWDSGGGVGSPPLANTGALGATMMVDFGKDVEIGYVQFRVRQFNTAYNIMLANLNYGGLISSLYSAPHAGGVPVSTFISNGQGDNIGGAAPTMTLTDAGAAFTASDVGRYITFAGWPTAANNGTFPIVGFTSATVISYTNASGVVEASGSGTWVITNVNYRLRGTSNGSIAANTSTMTVSSGDFLGPVTTGPFSNGAIVATQSTFVAPAATFVQGDREKILKITAGAGADIGSYRIMSVSLDGATLTIRNIDQTAKAWISSASGITYEVRDGVREEDQIIFTVASGAPHRLNVERLLTTTSLQVRMGPNTTMTSQSWLCLPAPWSLTKRLSSSTEAVPPEVKNNGTWITTNGCNNYNLSDALVYFDLTDLSTSRRTGRYWKWTGMPRWGGNIGNCEPYPTSLEFYDVAGNKLATGKYTSTDDTQTNADFYFSYLSRVDFIQSATDAMTGVAGFNGYADLGGANGDTIVCSDGGKFLGFQVRVPYTDGNTGSPNLFNSATAAWTTADVGRFIRMTSGTYSGNFYRIASRVSATQVTLLTPSGGSPGLATDAGPMNFTVHSGINVGGTAPDRFAVRRLGTSGDVVTTVATNQLNSGSIVFAATDLGKVIRVTGATADNGSYIIKTIPSTSQVTVTTTSGGAVSFLGGTGGTLEVDSDLREYTILTLNDALTTITISETLQPAKMGFEWEIRRPAYDTTSATTEPAKTARIVRPQSTYPVQSGDICQDSRGHYRFFSEDIGTGYQRADGVIAGGSGVLTGSGFCSDDVGRLLYIDTGANKGIYEISVFTSATSITVKNHYTGAAVSFTADAGPVTYRIFGDRRFRLAKYVTGLRA